MREFEKRLEPARANVKIQQGSLRIAESRFRNGAVSELDVTQAKSSLAQTEAMIPVLEKGERLANNRLCVLLGTPPRDLRPELGAAPIPAAPPEIVVGIPAELLRRRPDVRRAERQVAAQSALIGVAVADLFPAFTINGSISWQAQQFPDLFSSAANAGLLTRRSTGTSCITGGFATTFSLKTPVPGIGSSVPGSHTECKCGSGRGHCRLPEDTGSGPGLEEGLKLPSVLWN